MNKAFARDLLNCLNEVRPKGKRRKRARGSSRQMAIMPSRPQPRPRRRKRPRATPGTSGRSQINPIARGLTAGDIIISRSELLATTKAAGSATLLHPSSFPWLQNLAKVFERYRFLSIALEYRPLVGTQTPGSTAMGVDWLTSTVSYTLASDGSLSPALGSIDKTKILALTPSADTPVWQRISRLNVPSQMINSRLWYNASAPTKDDDVENFTPAYLVALSTADSQGEIWVHYRVHLSGTRSAS